MYLTLKDVLNISIMKNARLMSGESRLSTLVRWINVMEILDEFRQLQEGELLISTGYGIDSFTQRQYRDMVKSLVDKKIAAVALQPGYYFEQIPPDLIAIAKEYDLPIIELPPRITWGKITQAIHDEITRKTEMFDQRERAIHELISYIIFDHESAVYPFEQKAQLVNMNLNKSHLCALINASAIESLDTVLPYYYQIKTEFLSVFNVFISYLNDSFILLIENEPQDTGVYEKLKKSFYRFLNNYERPQLAMGVGCTYSNIFDLHKSYKEAMLALDFTRCKSNAVNCYIPWHEAGLPGLFLDSNINKLNDFSNYYVGRLVEYDEKNGTNYTETLRGYLYYLNQKNTADALYIHRQTLRYRLKRIEEILNTDLSWPDNIYKLHASLKINKHLTGK